MKSLSLPIFQARTNSFGEFLGYLGSTAGHICLNTAVWHGGLLELSPDQTHTLRCASRKRGGDYRIATQTFYQAAYAELASTMRSEALFPVATKGFYAFRDTSTRTQSVVLGFSPWSIRSVHNDTFTTPSAYFPTYTRLPFNAWFIAKLARRTASRKHDRYSLASLCQIDF